jgi:hypothetical protein
VSDVRNQLAVDFAHMRGVAAREPRDADDLLDALKEIYAAIFFADLSRYSVDEVKAAGPELLNGLFALRLSVRDKVPTWVGRGLMTYPVQAAIRDVFRAARYGGDMIGEIQLGHPRLEPGQATFAGFAGPEPNTLINPAFADAPLAFKPGDAILQRGMVHNSAAIARIGDVDSQFSHVGLVARDAAGALVVVEALIETGGSITPLGVNLGHNLGRAVLFRHKDQALAERAGQKIYEYVAKSRERGSNVILYDFSMALDGYDTLYCSKLVRLAYDLGSNGAIKLPPYPTRLAMKNRDFVARIGATATETFAPADLELATDFDIVAEWRDYRVTSELRLKDLIMTKLFEWMEFYDYRFKPDLAIRLIALGGRLSTHLSRRAQDLIASVTGGQVPPNMTGRAIGAVAMLHKTAEPIYRELAALEDETIRTTGRQMHPRQVFSELERIRARQGRRIGYLAR